MLEDQDSDVQNTASNKNLPAVPFKRKETGPIYFQAHFQGGQAMNQKSMEEIQNFTVWIVKEVS